MALLEATYGSACRFHSASIPTAFTMQVAEMMNMYADDSQALLALISTLPPVFLLGSPVPLPTLLPHLSSPSYLALHCASVVCVLAPRLVGIC